MNRFTTAAMALAIGFAPAAPAFAADDADGYRPSVGVSLDLLSVTDFALNPTDDAWIAVVQQIRAHPCYRIVGEERETCADDFGLSADLETTLSGMNFSSWLRDLMADSLCRGHAGAHRSSCVAGIPAFDAAASLRFRNQLTGDGAVGEGNGGGAPDDSSASNAELFARAGTAPTTRSNALRIIAENEAETGVETPYERSVMLWAWCEGSGLGQGGCFQRFQRFVEDDDVSADDVRDAVSRS